MDGKIAFPQILNLSSEKLDRQGLYMLENGLEIFIWVGRNVPAHVISALFGVESAAQINSGKSILPKLENDSSVRLHNLIQNTRNLRIRTATCYPHLYIVREDGDPNMRMWFLSHLIEDRLDTNHSYPQFLAAVRDKIPKVNN
jgi:protein transport protein SEC24